MPYRRLLLGDWSRVVRDPLDLMRLVFVGGTVVYAAMGRTSAIGLGAAAVLLLVARAIDLPRLFDLFLIVAMALIAWGTALGLYGITYYDKVVHLCAPLFCAPVLYIVLVRLGVLPDLRETREPHHEVGIFLVTLALGMAVSAGYEVVEWVSDSTLGTALVKSVDDTGGDLLAGMVGSAAGAALLVVWSVFGWGTVRRLPAEVLQEIWPRRSHRRTGQGAGAGTS
jgi:hypothetical protein